MNINKNAKEWLRQKRKSAKMTQEQMAKLLGISLTAYRDMETRNTNIINPTFLKAAEAIKADPREIFFKPSNQQTKKALTKLINALTEILNDIEE